MVRLLLTDAIFVAGQREASDTGDVAFSSSSRRTIRRTVSIAHCTTFNAKCKQAMPDSHRSCN